MNKFCKWTYTILAASGLALILILSKQVNQSVYAGLMLCMQTLIPSLFIFLALSDFALKTHALSLILKPFGWLCAKLFHIDKSLGTVLFMSLVCGYPVGARMLADLTCRGIASRATAERMLCFCVNAGPAFLIGSVGIPLFHSVSVGFIICLSHIIAFFAVGILTGIGKTAEPIRYQPNAISPAIALVESVQSAVRSMASICSFVLLFSGLLGLMHQLGVFQLFHSPLLEAGLTGILEVSNGIMACSFLPTNVALPLITAITAFGGICVHCQIKAMVTKANLSLGPFLRWRFLYCAISTGTCMLLSNMISIPVAASSSLQTHPEIASQTPVAAILLIILSATLLCCDKKTVIIKKTQKLYKG